MGDWNYQVLFQKSQRKTGQNEAKNILCNSIQENRYFLGKAPNTVLKREFKEQMSIIKNYIN